MRIPIRIRSDPLIFGPTDPDPNPKLFSLDQDVVGLGFYRVKALDENICHDHVLFGYCQAESCMQIYPKL